MCITTCDHTTMHITACNTLSTTRLTHLRPSHSISASRMYRTFALTRCCLYANTNRLVTRPSLNYSVLHTSMTNSSPTLNARPTSAKSISTTSPPHTSQPTHTPHRRNRHKQYASAALVATAATALYAVYVNNTTATTVSRNVAPMSTSAAIPHSTTLQPFTGPTEAELERMAHVISNKPIDAVTGVAVDTGIRILSENVIHSVLSKNTHTVPINRGHVASAEVTWYQANHPKIEDTFAIVPAMSVANGMLVGVFDGHSGSAASAFCRDELLTYIQEYKRLGKTQSLLEPLPFIHADNDFLDYCWLDNSHDSGLSGACAVAVHVDNNVIQAANIGDCRAIVARRNDGTFKTTYTAVELTQDHQIDTNDVEKTRLLSEHPNERDVINRNRVKGRLQPTRGMGM